jgi:hypothetical protein
MKILRTLLSVTIITIVLGLVVVPAYAQSPTPLTAEVDRTSLSTDEILKLTVKVDATKGSISPPQLPLLDGFDVLSSSSGTQITSVNGDMSVFKAYQYLLHPTKDGNLVIAPIIVSIDGVQHATNPIEISVLQGNGQVQSPPQSLNSIFPSLPGFPSLSNFLSVPAFPSEPRTEIDPSEAPEGLSGQDFYIEANVNNNSPYLNEQIVYTFRYYRAVQSLERPDYQKPNFTGFWSHSEIVQNEFSLNTGGRKYLVTELQIALVPTVVGDVTIDPSKLFIPGDFYSYEESLETQPIPLEILPLPVNAPQEFNGAVGQFTIQAIIDSMNTIVNEPLTVNITIQGQGNIETLADPEFSQAPEWRAFSNQTTIDAQFENGILSGSRSLEHVLVPTKAGIFIIPGISFSYFDPQSDSYLSINTDPLQITVDPDHNESLPGSSIDNKLISIPSLTSPNIRPIKQVTNVKTTSGSLIQKTGYWLLWTVPVVFLIGQYGWQLKNRHRINYPNRRQNQKAAKIAHNALRKMINNVEKSDHISESIPEITVQILTNYFAEKLNQPVVGLTRQGFTQLLLSRELDPYLVERVNTYLELCEIGIYNPGIQNINWIGLLSETDQLIIDLENTFNNN